MVASMSNDTDAAHAALETWARWANRALAELGWPRENAIYRIIKLGIRGAAHQTGIRMLEIDETCELIDRAVSRLDDVEREVVYRTYCGPPKVATETASDCCLTYQYYRQVLSRARKRIADFLEGAKSVA